MTLILRFNLVTKNDKKIKLVLKSTTFELANRK